MSSGLRVDPTVMESVLIVVGEMETPERVGVAPTLSRTEFSVRSQLEARTDANDKQTHQRARGTELRNPTSLEAQNLRAGCIAEGRFE